LYANYYADLNTQSVSEGFLKNYFQEEPQNGGRAKLDNMIEEAIRATVDQMVPNAPNGCRN
jgi:hypothetical protein